MSDDTTTPDIPDTVDESANGAPDESTIDYAKRYNDLRPEFDRTKQQLSELEAFRASLSDPQTRADALAELGLQLEADDDEELDTSGYDDPLDELRAELNALKADRQQELTAAQEEARQEAVADHILSGISTIEGEIGRELDEDETAFLSLRAQAEADDRGVPNVQAAWDALNKTYERRQQDWIKTKRAPRAPGGQSASKQPDLSTREGRLDHALGRYQATQDE